MSSDREPTLAEVILAAIQAKLADLHVMLPVQVQTYYPDDQTVDVIVSIKDQQVDEQGDVTESETFPVISGIPVSFQRCANSWQTMPLAAGDTGMVIFSDASLVAWSVAAKGNVTDPEDLLLHNFTGGVFVPGLTPPSSPIPSPSSVYPVWHTENELHLGEKSLGDANWVALAQATKSEIQALRDTVNNFVTVFNAHLHPSGMGPTGSPATPATAPAAVGDIKSTKVKAK